MPVDEAAKDKIQETIVRVMANFLKNFTISYTMAVVESLKENEEPITMKVMREPWNGPATYAIKTGYMEKDAPASGMFGGGWNKRFFVACNKDKCFSVEYYDKDPDDGGKMAKGQSLINLRPLSCERFNAAEREAAPSKFGVKLVPSSYWDRNGRTRHFRCENKDEEDAWFECLRYSCWKAEVPESAAGPLCDQAFGAALKQTAFDERCWDNFSKFTNEESLAKFVYFLVHRDVLQSIYDGIATDTMGRDAMINMADSMVNTMISIPVTATCASCAALVNKLTNTITAAVKPALDPLNEETNKLVATVGDLAEKTVGAGIKKILCDLFPGTMAVMAVPIGLALQNTIRGFNKYAKEKMVKSLEAAGSDEKMLNNVEKESDRQIHYYWQGSLREAYQAADDIPESIKDCAAFKQGTGISPRSCYWLVRDKCADFYHAANSKLMELYRADLKAGSVDINALIAKITGEMIHDAPEIIDDLYWEIFGECMRTNPLWRDNVVATMTGLVQPMADVVAAIPIVGTFLDPMDILDKCLESALRGCLSPAVKEATGGLIKVDALVAEFGADAASAAAD